MRCLDISWTIWATVFVTGLAGIAAAEDTQVEFEKAEKIRHEFVLDMEEVGAQTALVYVGQVLQLQKEEKFSGLFPFTSFRATENISGKSSTRFWQVKGKWVDNSFHNRSLSYDELLVDGERWTSHVGNPVIKYEPKDDRPFRYNYICLDPRMAIFVFAAGVEHSNTLDRNTYSPVLSGKIKHASQGLHEFKIVVNTKNYDAHVLFKESEGNRPVLAAFCRHGVDIGTNYEHANHLCQMRWKKSSEGKWMPEAGVNLDFFGQTRAEHQYFKRVSFQCKWMPLSELPDEIFDVENVDSSVGVRLASMREWIKLAEEIPPVSDLAARPEAR